MGKPEYLQGLDLEAFNADLITLNHNEGNYTIVNKICTLYQLKKEIGTLKKKLFDSVSVVLKLPC